MFVQTLVLVAVLYLVDLALRRRALRGGPLLAVGARAAEAVASRDAPHAGECGLLAPTRAGSRGDGLDNALSLRCPRCGPPVDILSRSVRSSRGVAARIESASRSPPARRSPRSSGPCRNRRHAKY